MLNLPTVLLFERLLGLEQYDGSADAERRRQARHAPRRRFPRRAR